VLTELPKTDEASPTSTVTVFSLPVPGLGADSITAETKGNRLVLTNKQDKEAMMEMDLPSGLKDVQLTVEHGILRVHAHKDKPHTVQVTTASAA
jgi:HSP20 family molecular chaperone IbpA